MSANSNDVTNSMYSKNAFPLFQYSLFKGCSIGAVEAGINHPLWQIKTRLQNKDPFTLNPRVLYRGIAANVISTMPLTVIQVTGTKFMEQNCKFSSRSEACQQIFNAFSGGALSAVVSTPIELLMSHKKETESYTHIIKKIHVGGFKRFYTGFWGTTMREGIYTVGYLSAPSLVEKQLKTLFPQQSEICALVSSPIAGITAAVFSHPFDTIKARQQNMVLQTKTHFLGVAKDLVQKDGLLSFYRGLLPRGIMIASAVTILDKTSKKMDEHFKARI